MRLVLAAACVAGSAACLLCGCGGCRGKATSPSSVRPAPTRPGRVATTAPPSSSSASPNPKDHSASWKVASKSRAEPQTASVSRETLEAWAVGLRKKDAEQLPALLAWTETLLAERPSTAASASGLAACCGALARLATAGSHELASQLSSVAVQASSQECELCLEILNSLYKDRRGSVLTAPEEVAALAVKTLKAGAKGSAKREVYQRASRLVHFLATESSNRARLLACGCAAVLLEAMDKLQDDPGTMLECLGCLRHICDEPSLDAAQAARLCLACLRRHPKNGHIQWLSLCSLHALQGWEKDAGLDAADLAFRAGSQHPQFSEVVEWTSKLLLRLAKIKSGPVLAWLSTPEKRAWLKKFRDGALGMRKTNTEAENAATQLCKLCKS